MDVNKLVEVLKATLDPNRREEAEAQLNEVRYFRHVFNMADMSRKFQEYLSTFRRLSYPFTPGFTEWHAYSRKQFIVVVRYFDR